MAGGSAPARVLPYKNIIIMTQFQANKIVDFFDFMMMYRKNPLFSWEVKQYENRYGGYEIIVSVLNPIFTIEIIDIVSLIAYMAHFRWQFKSDEVDDYAIVLF